MKVAIVTVAGISSRFNEGIPEPERKLKAIFSEDGDEQTLLYHLLSKCSFADKIVVVGGYKYDALQDYCSRLKTELRDKITVVVNTHYEDLASGYSLYLGLREAFRQGASEVLFVEGDLDIDEASFKEVAESESSVLTYNYEPIYANKAVVLFQNDVGEYRYAFNSGHGLLTIDGPFACILNSGQMWKFTDIRALHEANEEFYTENKGATNLSIIQKYLQRVSGVKLVGLKRWTNCNTRGDYRKIKKDWETER